MKCKTCAHPRRQDIDQALLARTHTLEALSQQYGLTVSSLFRHKQHLVENLDRTRDRLRNSQQMGHLLKLNAILDQVERAVDAAEADGNVDRVLRGAGVGARIIHQMNRMDVPLDLDTVYLIISSPQWVSQASLLPTDPQIITGIHRALADIALFPCPDPLPETAVDEKDDDADAAAADDHEEAVEVDEEPPNPFPFPSSLLPGASPDEAAEATPETLALETRDSQLGTLVQQLLARLSPIVNPDRETTPKNQREKSAKLSKNSPRSKENSVQYQQNNLCEKNFAKNPCVGRESVAPPAILASAAPAAVKKLSPHPAQSIVPEIETRQKANDKWQTIFKTSPDPVIQAFPVLTSKFTPESDRSETPSAYDQDDCIVPLKNERYHRRGIF